jgi:hypothetical protein
MLETATIHILWVMGQLSAPVFPAYLDESVKLREVSPTTPNKDQALPPVEGIIGHRQQIGQPFPLQEKNTDNLYLPTSARTSIADWLCSVPAKLPKKVSPKVSTALVDTATPTLSCVSCKCSPPCSTLS